MGVRGLEDLLDDETADDAARERARALKKQGAHVEAAEHLFAQGLFVDAGELFESVFEFGRALQCFEQAGDVTAAMRVALRAEVPGAVDRIVSEAVRTGQGDALIRMLREAQRHDALAKILFATGDLEGAARAYEDAGQLNRAGEVKEELGDLRGAGVLYERALEASPDDPELGIRLGRILARFSRHDDAIKLLQRALAQGVDVRETLARAGPVLILSFLELGYPVAAEAVFERWQRAGGQHAPGPDDTLATFLSSPRATALAATMVGAMRAAESARTVVDDPFFGGAASADAPRANELGTERAAAQEGTALLAGRYLLGEPLGGGGVGQVFRAYDALLDQPVAVKIFGSQATGSDAVQAFARDTRAAASLGHSAILPLVELNMSLGYVATAFSAAPTVEDVLRQGGDAVWLAAFVRGVLDVLGACHRTGLVHGALKPTNLFLAPGGVRVVDFGAHHLLALRSTETGGLASAWPYLAPEQLFGATPDVSADLYAVAAIVYRALTGKPPFSSVEADRQAVPPPPSSLVPALASWDAFFARALAPQREARFGDIQEMLDALPPVPRDHVLPPSVPLVEKTPAALDVGAEGRYLAGPLVFREPDRAKVFEGQDILLERPVWIVEAADDDALAALRAAAAISRGAQAIYDVIPERRHVVVARDATGHLARFDELRAVPQGLFRDLASVAVALESLHAAGFAIGGFELERAIGPVGPRLRLAPATLPVPYTPEAQARDEAAFGALVHHVLADDGAAASSYGRADVAALLEGRRLFTRADMEQVLAATEGATWSRFCEAVAERLVLSAPQRVIARLAVNVLKGEG